jgi:hypothetical protein
MGLMDSINIQYIWKAIQESERSDENLHPHTKEASGHERAVANRPNHFVWPRNRHTLRRKTPKGTGIRVPRPMRPTHGAREPQTAMLRNTAGLHSQFTR